MYHKGETVALEGGITSGQTYGFVCGLFQVAAAKRRFTASDGKTETSNELCEMRNGEVMASLNSDIQSLFYSVTGKP
jgi:hypothetical protein